MMTITWLVSLDILGWVSSSLMMNVTVAGLIHSRAWMPLDGHHYQRFYDHRRYYNDDKKANLLR